MNEERKINRRNKGERRIVLRDAIPWDRRRRHDGGIDDRETKDLTILPNPPESGLPQDDEQCAHILTTLNKFCGFYFAKHLGSFQHEFVRPPLLTDNTRCANCGTSPLEGVILKAMVIKGEARVLCNAPGCFKTASSIRLRRER